MAILGALALLVGGIALTPTAAEADSITFKVRSFSRYSVDLKFFSQNRNHFWPSASTHWVIKDYNVHDYKLTCVRGERICFGASTTGAGRSSWGRGLSGKMGCSNCCYTCNGDTTTPIINFNES